MFPFKTSLNASTLFPFNLSLPDQIRTAAEAGYEGVELWVGEIEAYLEEGGTTAELKALLVDSGVSFVNAIAFFKWADQDPGVREAAFVQAEREIRMLAELGCQAVAAPPFGDVKDVSLHDMAGYYARLVKLGRSLGVEPILEFWGRADKLSQLGEAQSIMEASGYTDVKVLLDPFHMYTGGSSVDGLAKLEGEQIGIFHANDYPAVPPRETIADADRVFPGEGIAPSKEIARILYASGYRGYVSLELFITDFGDLSALDVARKGLMALKDTYQVED
ncbi:sugar phosphate isomerase/epimerase family protein [Paenibacillus nasutitermitis]|uniref:Xylose isomerase n=1 Tax=Paenibacillus nasutitermitis TaxID=1652958 RepID=A0A917DZB5_9BACL|nr:sugar phosphate isomerase/epimerase family protein [Paenibacillus nasutitermitis]GGD84524.1 xylose isomerase [Paenibacillus nasutitermitis]